MEVDTAPSPFKEVHIHLTSAQKTEPPQTDNPG